MKEKYVAPKFQVDGFHCPHCGVWAHQKWFNDISAINNDSAELVLSDCSVSYCEKCTEYALWLGSGKKESGVLPADGTLPPKPKPEPKMIYPASSIAPLPTEDMPEDVKADFIEARNIVNASPRATAALLRLALQKLMPHLGEKGKNINDDIASLVAKGLPVRIQQALDTVRVIGNEAVHPGVMDLKDDTKTATALFDLLNVIVEVMITQPQKIEAIFTTIPDTKKDAIKKRNRQA